MPILSNLTPRPRHLCAFVYRNIMPRRELCGPLRTVRRMLVRHESEICYCTTAYADLISTCHSAPSLYHERIGEREMKRRVNAETIKTPSEIGLAVPCPAELDQALGARSSTLSTFTPSASQNQVSSGMPTSSFRAVCLTILPHDTGNIVPDPA